MMAKKKSNEIILTQEMLDKIIPPFQSEEDEIIFRKKLEEEYEKTKQEILELMKKITDQYKDQ